MTAGSRRIATVVLTAAVLASLWCGVFSPPREFSHYFVFEISTTHDVSTQVYFERGAGWRESEWA